MTETSLADDLALAEPRRMVALTGFMGCGKTATGQELARLRGWDFVDLDSVIEQQERTSIREIFQQRGEAEFRAIETAALQRFVAGCSRPAILALGGGAYAQPSNAELLRTSKVGTVFLEAPIEDMLRRCGVEEERDAENARPLAANPAGFRKLYEERLPSYRGADLTVRTMGKTVTEVACEIAQRLRLAEAR